jgi:hypothetical protein
MVDRHGTSSHTHFTVGMKKLDTVAFILQHELTRQFPVALPLGIARQSSPPYQENQLQETITVENFSRKIQSPVDQQFPDTGQTDAAMSRTKIAVPKTDRE